MPKTTLHSFQKKKEAKEPITMLTAYDYPTALLLDESGVDMVLVGDSVGMVVHGFDSTIRVTLDMMIMHCAAVSRGLKRAYLVGDLPFSAYQISIEEAKRNAARLLVEGGVDAVKLEGGQPIAPTIKAVRDMGIAVMAHVGLTPQSISAMGGFRVQGKSLEQAQQIVKDALAVQEAGAFAIVLEGIPRRLAALITEKLEIPTIGIGAGVDCDGQVLVINDLLNHSAGFAPKFVRQYEDVAVVIKRGVDAYLQDVRERAFPGREHGFRMSDEVFEAVQRIFD